MTLPRIRRSVVRILAKFTKREFETNEVDRTLSSIVFRALAVVEVVE